MSNIQISETNTNLILLRIEKLGTLGIGFLLIALALGTAGTAVALLALHQEPTTSNGSLIISASALVIMILIWLPKRYLAKALDSSIMRGEATCSLSCIQITCVLFVGSLLFRVWRGGWWVDSATSIVLSILFAWEGFKMVRWAFSAGFSGGCCQSCRIDSTPMAGGAELGEVYRDICKCCSENEGCRDSDECKCSPDGTGQGIDTIKQVNIHTEISVLILILSFTERLLYPNVNRNNRNKVLHQGNYSRPSCSGSEC